MDFSFSDMHLEIKKLSGAILSELATVDHLKACEKTGAYLDTEIWNQLKASGIHTASLPEDLGGMGMDFFAATQVAECIGQSVASIPYIPCIVSTALPLLAYTADPVVEKLLRAISAGEQLATAALIEPGNENTFTPSTTASQINDVWQLNGVKHCVPYAHESQQVLLFAKVGDELWAGLVDPQATGVTLTAQQCTTQEPQCQLTLANAPAYCVCIGKDAEQLLQAVVAMTTVAYCSMAVGVAEKMTRISAEYTSHREQFGVAIATFQSVAHRLADAYIDTECLKIITLKAASDVNNGIYDSEAISMAKVWCGDVMARVSQTAQHVHGGTGIDRDYHLFRYCLWAKFLELALGSTRVHLTTIADNLAARYQVKK